MKKRKKFKRKVHPRRNPLNSKFTTRIISHKKKKTSKEFCRKFKQDKNED